MKHGLFHRMMAMLLAFVMVLSLVYVPNAVQAEETTEETTEDTLTVQDILGDNWYVSWNGGAVAETEYLSIVEGGAHGKFALRIGHPTESTEMTLRYKLYKADLGVAATTGIGMGMRFAAKIEGALLDGSFIGVTNPVTNAAGGNRFNYDISAVGSEWTVINESHSGSDAVWSGGEYDHVRLEFAISLEAGNYLYLDDVRGYGLNSGSQNASFGDMRYINVVHNGSFEQWYGSYNETALYTQDSDFVRIVDGGYSGDRALQLGSSDKATNYTLQTQISVSHAGNLSFDLWAKTEGTVTVADVIMRNGLEDSGTTYSLAGVGTEWTHIEHTEGLTDVAVDSGNLVVEIHVELPAGSYLYLDDIQIVWGYDSTMSNLLSDGGFEGVSCLYYYDTTWESAINEVQKKLGKNWYVSSYSGNLAATEYLNIVEGGSHGNYSLRIGHPTEATSINLKYRFYKSDLGVDAATALGMVMQFKAKVEGAINLDDSWISMTNPVANAGGGNRNNLSAEEMASIGSEWGDTYLTTDMWCGAEYDQVWMEFAINLDADNYLYVDDIQCWGIYAGAQNSPFGDMRSINVMHNGSFEKWDCVWNADGETTNGEFAQIIEGGRSGNVLRLGHADKVTDYTLNLKLAAPQADGYSFDLWAKTEGEITDAAFELFNGDTAGARCRYSLTDVGSEWTHISHTYGVTDVWVDSGTLLVQIYVYLPAGSYLYLDDIQIVKGMSGVYYDNYSNMLADGMFQGYALGFDQPTMPVTPELSTFVGAHKAPAGWYCTWEGEDQYRSNYLTSDAYSGNYALAMTGVESNMDYTIAHSINGLEEGAEYTFEGYFKKVGDFSYISLMYGSTFLSLKNESIPTWTKYTGTFTAGTGTTFSIFAVSPQGGQLLVDDLVIYKSDDETKTNLLENGDFETASGAAYEQLKIDKAFSELPISVEAQLRLHANAEQGGVILSNYNGKTGYTVGINANGQPYVTAVLSDGTVLEGIFADVDVRTGEVVTLNISNADSKLTCSVNGEVKQTLDTAITADAVLYANAFAIAGDNTYANENYFTGDLISLSVSGAQGVIAQWAFEGLTDPNVIADTTGNGYHALYVGEYFDELPSDLLEKYPYTFVAVGDTQYTNRGDTQKGKDYMGGLYQWIIDNQEKYNIQAVLGMGDITDTPAATDDETQHAQAVLEWEHATESINKLNDAGIPFTLLRGNHDSIPGINGTNVDSTFFDTYAQLMSYDSQIDGWYEEGGTRANAYKKMTVGQTDWLIVMLDWDHSAEVIDWAYDLIAAHPEHKVIVTTHGYQSGSGGLYTSQLMGQGLWDALISQHENIELVLCGDSSADPVKVVQTLGKGKNIVTSMTIDHQTQDLSAYMTAGKIPYAMATLLMFSEDGSEVVVADYATGMSKFYRADGVQYADLSDAEYGFGEQSSVAQWGLTLGEDIGVAFDMQLEDAIVSDENAKLMIAVGENEAVAYDIPEVNEEGYYTFTVRVAAAQMTEEITLQFVSGVQEGAVHTYTVKGYADQVLSGDYDDATKALVTAMLSYGGKAQAYFGYNTDAMADADITAPAAAEIPGSSGVALTGSVSGIRFYGATVLFESRTAIRYYFTVTGDLGEYVFTDGDGNTYTPVQKGTLYYVEIAGINPQEMDSQFVIQVTKTGSEEALTVSYGCLDYISRMYYKASSVQALKDLLQSLYDYHLAAKVYIAQ